MCFKFQLFRLILIVVDRCYKNSMGCLSTILRHYVCLLSTIEVHFHQLSTAVGSRRKLFRNIKLDHYLLPSGELHAKFQLPRQILFLICCQVNCNSNKNGISVCCVCQQGSCPKDQPHQHGTNENLIIFHFFTSMHACMRFYFVPNFDPKCSLLF